MCPLFLRGTDVMATRLSVVFRRLVGDRPMSPQFRKVHHLPISITSVLSKVLECLVSVRVGRFMECCGVLPTTQFTYW